MRELAGLKEKDEPKRQTSEKGRKESREKKETDEARRCC